MNELPATSLVMSSLCYPPGRNRTVISPTGTAIELLVDVPDVAPLGCVVIAHPHPLLGGSALHPVSHEIAMAAVAQQWISVRPNFRGVGQSQGEYSHGDLETDDLLQVVAHARTLVPGAPLLLVGFSFGAHVIARVSDRLRHAGLPEDALLLISMPDGPTALGRHYITPLVPPQTSIVHGQHDEIVPLQQVLDYAERSACALTVFPGTDHLFRRSRKRLSEFLNAWFASVSTGLF